MKKKILALLIACALPLSIMAGCGANDNSQNTQPTTQDQTASGTDTTTQTAAPETSHAPVTLNVATAGDTNMTEFFQNEIAPAFTAKYPYITVKVTGTGAGDDGSRAILTKWDAQQKAGSGTWDIDLGCVNESVMQELVQGKLIQQYVPSIENAKNVNTPASKMSLGFNIEGYVVPLFQSQVVLAYNPDKVATPPKTMDEVEQWIKDHPNRFGYNGVTGGMSGVGFVSGFLYAKTGDYQAIAKGTYDAGIESKWNGALKELKSLPVTYTQGNNGTLDMLNRGEIDMGAVWVDMLLLWKSNGQMNPNIKMFLPDPGLPGQPMYMVIGSGSANSEAAQLFCNFLADPQVQAQSVVGKYTWYPGIDPTVVFDYCSDDAKAKLFTEVTADEIAKKGLAMPLVQYRTDIQTMFDAIR